MNNLTTNLINGLSSNEVNVRIKKGLTNKVDKKIYKTNSEIIKENVLTLFNFFNFSIAIALFIVHAYSNMFFILIIITNILIGIIQEIHARNLIEKLNLIATSKTTVIRDKKKVHINIEDIVVDDILILAAGEQLCVDCIIINGTVEVNESLLTGESDNILKNVDGKLLSGSYITSGECYCKVTNVGENTYSSKIMSNVKKAKKISSELLDSIRKVTKFTSFFIIPTGILMFIEAAFINNIDISNSVIFTSAALLGMLPKGLVLLISISLASGIIKLAKKEVLIQNLYSLEALAHVDTLCLDKTGTITTGQMCISKVQIINDSISPISVKEAMNSFVGQTSDNNSTFLALKEYFKPDTKYKKIDNVPFSSERKWSAITFEDVGTFILGAPEKLINQVQTGKLLNKIKDIQKSGKRVLCLGYTKSNIHNFILPQMDIVAIIELEDPLRKNSKNMLNFFKSEGVDIKIISGDNVLTVSNIAKEAGLENYNSYIDLSTTNEDINDIVNKYSIFGRVSPTQKSEIIKALKKQGHTVAMTGDGVNDIIALKEADCSISMSSGSDAVKNVAQIVLLNSDFSVLKDILMEGRRVVNNIRNVATVFFIKTIYSIILSILCIITFSKFPFIPIQITLIDLAIEAYTSLFLTFEANNKKVKGSFLNTVIRNSLPFSLTIIIGFIMINVISLILNISQSQITTLMYFTIGFTSILAIIKICRPFNKLRLFLCTTTGIGFFTAVFLFKNLLHLEMLSTQNFILFIILACIYIFIKNCLSKIITMSAKKLERII